MKIKYVLIAFLALFIGAIFLGRCTTMEERTRLNDAILALRDTVSHHEVTIDGLKHQVFEKDQIILTEREAKKAGLLEINRLKALNIKHVNQITVLQAEIKSGQDNLPIPDTVFKTITVSTGPAKYVSLPFKTNYKDDYINLSTWIEETGTWGFDLYQPLDLNITAGDKKVGFLKTEPTVIVDTPNPYVTINNIDYVNVQKRKLKWWQQSAITIVVWEGIKYGINSVL